MQRVSIYAVLQQLLCVQMLCEWLFKKTKKTKWHKGGGDDIIEGGEKERRGKGG